MKEIGKHTCTGGGFILAVFAVAGLALLLPGSAAAQTLVTTVALPSTGGDASLDPASNLLYTGGSNPGAQPVDIVNLYTFGVTQPGINGHVVGTNRLNDNYWVPGIYSGAVQVYDVNNNLLNTINLGYCPLFAAFDQKHKQMWVGAQCGAYNDPVWAIDSTTFAIKAGPIGLGGVNYGVTVDPVTGVAYVSENGCERVDPVTYTVTVAPFSPNCPLAADAVNGHLYVLSGSTTLQIWNGKTNPEKLLKSITLPYSPVGSWGVNDALDHLYIQENGTSTIDIRSSLSGTEIASFTASGLTPGGQMAVDSTRGRVYINSTGNGGQVLYVIDDISTVRKPGTRGY